MSDADSAYEALRSYLEALRISISPAPPPHPFSAAADDDAPQALQQNIEDTIAFEDWCANEAKSDAEAFEAEVLAAEASDADAEVEAIADAEAFEDAHYIAFAEGNGQQLQSRKRPRPASSTSDDEEKKRTKKDDDEPMEV